ncbi:MAG: NAD(+)/NADH kinase [Armatimonadota bacterium]
MHANNTPIQSIGIMAAVQKPEAVEYAAGIARRLAELDISVRLNQDMHQHVESSCECCDDEALAQTDVIIVLGGDGTLLRIARAAAPHDTPLLGLDVGSFGFLATEKPQFAVDHLQQIVDGDFFIEQRLMLQATMRHADGSDVVAGCGLNDVVVTGSEPHRAVRLRTAIDDECVCSHRVDGMILSTPTGSTAYNLSAGGPIADPRLDVILVTPLNPHVLCTRPVVVPGGSEIAIALAPDHKSSQHLNIFIDGQVSRHVPDDGDVLVSAAPHRAKLAHLRSSSFYANLTDKLNMG